MIQILSNCTTYPKSPPSRKKREKGTAPAFQSFTEDEGTHCRVEADDPGKLTLML